MEKTIKKYELLVETLKDLSAEIASKSDATEDDILTASRLLKDAAKYTSEIKHLKRKEKLS